jgi:hypothetical protein
MKRGRVNGIERGDFEFSIFREDEIWADYRNEPPGSISFSKKG